LIPGPVSDPDPSKVLFPNNKYKTVKIYIFKKNTFFAMFSLSAVQMYFSSTIRFQKCTDFKKSAFLRCLDDLQFKLFFINNPDLDPKLILKPDPEKKITIIISDPQHWLTARVVSVPFIDCLCKLCKTWRCRRGYLAGVGYSWS
jgi:hypothetical protein